MTMSGQLLDRFLRYIAMAGTCQTDLDSASTLGGQIAHAKLLKNVFEARSPRQPRPLRDQVLPHEALQPAAGVS